MTWANPAATESRVAPEKGPEQGPAQHLSSQGAAVLGSPSLSAPPKSPRSRQSIIIGRKSCQLQDGGPGSEVFTMSLGTETIELLPFRNWGQLDVYKWKVQGKLPDSPAGLEVTPEHVKMAGQTVSIQDPDGCKKLEKEFNEWLEMEYETLELARKKTQARSTPAAINPARDSTQQPLRFHVELDKRSQVHISCLQGAELVAAVGLSLSGLNGLASQGLMRKPRSLQVGALHDWIQLDGELCSFEHGNNDADKLEKLLNEHYRPSAAAGQGKDIVIFANAASPTGFDIQFPVTIGGVQENRRRTLNEAALELLQEPVRCGLLQPGLILKISPPTLIIKRKTPDGGEAYLEKSSAHTIPLTGDDGRERLIDLSQPINYTRLSVVELTVILNHSLINRHSKSVVPAPTQIAEPARAAPAASMASSTEAALGAPIPITAPPVAALPSEPKRENVVSDLPPPIAQSSPPPAPKNSPDEISPISAPKPLTETAPRPNTWLKDVLAQAPIRFDWFTCLLYRKLAEHFANSGEVELPLGKCWTVLMGSSSDPSDPRFKAVFLTQKGGLGFLCGTHLVRFHRGVVFAGSEKSVLEGIGVDLVAVGLIGQNQIVFIVQDEFRSKFGVPADVVRPELQHLREAGALLLTVQEVLESAEPVEAVWTVPAEQPDPLDPQAFEHVQPPKTPPT